MTATTVNRVTLAALLGCTLPTVDANVRAGMPGLKTTANEWEFSVPLCVAWLVKRAENRKGTSMREKIDTERARKLAADAKSAELDLGLRLAELSTTASYEAEWANRFAMLRQNIMTVPARAALSLVGEKSEARIREVLEGELTEALTRTATIEDDETEEAEEATA